MEDRYLIEYELNVFGGEMEEWNNFPVFTLGWKKSTSNDKCLAKFGKYPPVNVSGWPTQNKKMLSKSFSYHPYHILLSILIAHKDNVLTPRGSCNTPLGAHICTYYTLRPLKGIYFYNYIH